jgi:hypothetical protein
MSVRVRHRVPFSNAVKADGGNTVSSPDVCLCELQYTRAEMIIEGLVLAAATPSLGGDAGSIPAPL